MVFLIRKNLMWNRNIRQFAALMGAFSFVFVISKLYGSVPSNLPFADVAMSDLTEEQLKLLQAFKPPLQQPQKPQGKDVHALTEKKGDPESPTRVRSDALVSGLQKICKNLNVTLPITAFMLAHMHFDHKRQAIYCFVPKVACTSWKRIWMKMTGLVKPDKNLSELSRYTIHTSIPAMNTLGKDYSVADMLAKYKKFMFMRHPFDRVLSAYKDKLEHEDTESKYNFHREIGVRIQKKYRNPHLNHTGHDVTFPEFIKFISEPGRGTSEQRNEHWLSVHEICNPCAVKYDFIGRYETLKEDSHYVLDWLGASELIKEFPVSDRPFHAKRYDPKYFNQLGHATKLAFFQKYLLDFAAFNYTFI